MTACFVSEFSCHLPHWSTRCYPQLWNWNAVQKPLVVQLWATRYCELYSLWTTLPHGILLWGCVCFSTHFSDVVLVLFSDCTNLLKWCEGSMDLHPAHASLIVRQFLVSTKVIVISHPPFLPDLAPCDFFLFPKVQKN